MSKNKYLSRTFQTDKNVFHNEKYQKYPWSFLATAIFLISRSAHVRSQIMRQRWLSSSYVPGAQAQMCRPPVGDPVACFLVGGSLVAFCWGWHCLPKCPAGSVACRASHTASVALLPPCHAAGPMVHRAIVWLVCRWRWLQALAVCILFNRAWGGEVLITSNALLELALWYFHPG
jgi:hypothetical protein